MGLEMPGQGVTVVHIVVIYVHGMCVFACVLMVLLWNL